MAATTVSTAQFRDADVSRADMNVSTAGRAVITKVIAGTNTSLTSTGADAGTGDVTLNAILPSYARVLMMFGG